MNKVEMYTQLSFSGLKSNQEYEQALQKKLWKPLREAYQSESAIIDARELKVLKGATK